MKLCAVLAGCLVVACCTVNTQAEKCPDNIIFVFACLDKSNTAQWGAVKNYTKLIVQHMLGTADESTPRLGLLAVDGEANSTDANTDLVALLKENYAKNKRELMAFIDLIKTNRMEIKLEESVRKIMQYFMFPYDPDFGSKANSIVLIKDGSVTGEITTREDDYDMLHNALKMIEGRPVVVHFIRINDAVEDANVTTLKTWFDKQSDHSMVDHAKSDYTALTPLDAFNFVKDELHCDPFGKADDPLEASATGITLPPPPTQQPHAGTTSSNALSLTKTSGVVGLWSSVLIVTTAMSAF